MPNPPPDTKNFVREFYLMLAAFVVGFVATLLAIQWLILHVVEPDTRWWDILHMDIGAIMISVLGGLCLAALTCLLSGGMTHPCPYCGRPVFGTRYCSCAEAQAWKRSCEIEMERQKNNQL